MAKMTSLGRLVLWYLSVFEKARKLRSLVTGAGAGAGTDMGRPPGAGEQASLDGSVRVFRSSGVCS